MRSMSSAMMSWNDFDFQIEGAKMLMGLDVHQEGVRSPQHSLLVDLAFGI